MGSWIALQMAVGDRNIDAQVVYNLLRFLSLSETQVSFLCLILLDCKEKGYIMETCYRDIQAKKTPRAGVSQQKCLPSRPYRDGTDPGELEGCLGEITVRPEEAFLHGALPL